MGAALQQNSGAGTPPLNPTAAQQASQGFKGATGMPSLIDILAGLGLITSPPPQQKRSDNSPPPIESQPTSILGAGYKNG